MNSESENQTLPVSPLDNEEAATIPLASAKALPVRPPLAADVLSPIRQETITALWTEKIASGASPQATLKGTAVARPAVALPRRRVAGPGTTTTTDYDYRLLQRIGEGGMGTVYLAHQASVDRLVALKFLRDETAQSAEYLANFVTEGIVMGNLDHPNILPIYDLGVDEGGHFFIAMKYVQGTPWSHMLGNLSLPENLNILRRVADATAFAHSKGILHLDLKPANVMLGEFGEVLVTDWGVAASLTRMGKARPLADMSLVGGTPAYMPPEMARMETARIDVRADVYLLGAILFEILVGVPPHPGDNLKETLVNAAQNLLAAALPDNDLGAMARKALSAQPSERYATVREFQAALRAYEEHFESNALSAAAQKDLARAEISGAYDDYAQALYGFHNALKLWPGNSAAAEGLARARLAYAACAFRRGDFDLALSQLDANDERHRALREKVKAAQKARAEMAEAKARAEERAREEGERFLRDYFLPRQHAYSLLEIELANAARSSGVRPKERTISYE
ncbi:MAG: serine/threonine protein kinase, partial [Planctomycetota bacterium]|nr:serine/threonine protein kinase [Planctomycetota bacterium]